VKTASITEAKNNLSALIDGLRGGPVLILDRGRPVARLEAAGQASADERIADLERRGVISRPEIALEPDFFQKHPPLPQPPGVSALKFLLEEREEGR
jgi:antitoxin (DNA-binding transcriptional repressor) of toxin-antitoxin stability system